MSIYETSITNPKKQLEFYKQLSEQLQQENKILKENAENNDKVVDKINWENNLLKQKNKKYKEIIDKIIGKEEEIMYLANKVAITTQNIEVKAVRDRLEDIFEILKGDSNE